MTYWRFIPTFLMFIYSAYTQAASELVMHEGTVIEASNDNSAIKISAGKGHDRVYEYDRCVLKSRGMMARYERWFGSLGIYDPAGQSTLFYAPTGCKGLSRTVVQEGQIHFDNMQFANAWIRRQEMATRRSGETVWSNNGLLVSWNAVPDRRQLNVDVWLICINGRRPEKLDGAMDRAVRVFSSPQGQTTHNCASVGQDVVDQTRQQLQEEWRTMDDWMARRHGSGARN